MNHSEGPWELRARVHADMFFAVFDQEGRLVVNLGDGGLGIVKQTGNGYMIAASPEMYEYIKEKALGGDVEAAGILEKADGRYESKCAVCHKVFERRQLRDHDKFLNWPLCDPCCQKVDEADRAMSAAKVVKVTL
jgi:hypothetical protein